MIVLVGQCWLFSLLLIRAVILTGTHVRVPKSAIAGFPPCEHFFSLLKWVVAQLFKEAFGCDKIFIIEIWIPMLINTNFNLTLMIVLEWNWQDFFKGTRSDTRPIPVADGWVGAEMHVFPLFDSCWRTDRRTDGQTDKASHRATSPRLKRWFRGKASFACFWHPYWWGGKGVGEGAKSKDGIKLVLSPSGRLVKTLRKRLLMTLLNVSRHDYCCSTASRYLLFAKITWKPPPSPPPYNNRTRQPECWCNEYESRRSDTFEFMCIFMCTGNLEWLAKAFTIP